MSDLKNQIFSILAFSAFVAISWDDDDVGGYLLIPRVGRNGD